MACGAPQAIGLRGSTTVQEASSLLATAGVEMVTLQDGQRQRSIVNRARFKLSADIVPTSFQPTVLQIRNVGGDVLLPPTEYSVQYNESTREVEWVLHQAESGRSLPNGHYQFEMRTTSFETLDPGYRFASDFTFSFQRLLGDFNGNGLVDSGSSSDSDTNLLTAAWGAYRTENAHFDLSGDRLIDSVDMGILLGLL